METLAPAAVEIVRGRTMSARGFRTLEQQLTGRDPLDVEELWDEMYLGAAYYGRDGIGLHCISAIDNCLWAIRAEVAGMPLARLLGSYRHESVLAYASTLFRKTPEATFEAARKYAARGFRAVKFGWGGFGWDLQRDEALLEAAREGLGPSRELMIDPGWFPIEASGGTHRRSRRRAFDLCEMAARFHPTWIEDFVRPDDWREYTELRQRLEVPIAAGEQLGGTAQFRQLIDAGAVDFVQPDLSRCGGITVAREVAVFAKHANVDVVTHSWLTGLLASYSLGFLGSLARAPYFELNVAQSELSRRVCPEQTALRPDGTVAARRARAWRYCRRRVYRRTPRTLIPGLRARGST